MRNFCRWLACSWFVASALLVVPPPARAAYHTLEEIPVESAVYRLLDDLASTYALSNGLLQTRPWTRGDLGAFLDQLVADVPAAAADPAVIRLRRELEPAGGLQGLEPMISAEEDDASIEFSPYARFGYTQDDSRGRITRDVRAGGQVSLAYGAHALLFTDVYAGTITPGAHGTPDEHGAFTANSTDVTTWLDRAYGTWATKGFSLRAGRTWLRWGPGIEGTLALSDAAPAFDLIEARLRLPGGARLTWFLGSLDPDLETYLAGQRIELRAGPSVDVGVSGLVRFDGTSKAPLFLLPVIPFSLFERRLQAGRAAPNSRTNLLVATDFSWTWRPGIRVYGELAVDDATRHNTRPLALAWQVGAHLRRRIGDAAWTARAEYTRVYDYMYSVSYRQDFAHDGFPIGYPLGPDVDRWFGRIEWRPDAMWAWGVEASDIRNGVGRLGQPWIPGTPVPTRLVLGYPVDQDIRVAVTADLAPSPSFTLGLKAGTARGEFRDHIVGNDGDGKFGSAQLTWRW